MACIGQKCAPWALLRAKHEDCGLRIVDCGLRIVDCGLRIVDCGMRIVE